MIPTHKHTSSYPAAFNWSSLVYRSLRASVNASMAQVRGRESAHTRSKEWARWRDGRERGREPRRREGEMTLACARERLYSRWCVSRDFSRTRERVAAAAVFSQSLLCTAGPLRHIYIYIHRIYAQSSEFDRVAGYSPFSTRVSTHRDFFTPSSRASAPLPSAAEGRAVALITHLPSADTYSSTSQGH